MRRAGSESWQVRVDDGCPQALAIALFVRAAAGLAVATEPPLPPLDEAVVAQISPGHDLAAAAVQWARWWEALVDGDTTLVDMEPPTYGLRQSPELRGIVAEVFDDAVAWSGDRARSFVEDLMAHGPVGIEGDVVREAEEEAGRPAQPFTLHVTVLPLAGQWWDQREADHILVSEELRNDETAYWSVLRPLIDGLL